MKIRHGRRSRVWLCALVVAGAGGVALGQGVFSFSDDFNRDAWDNAQTNAFLPAWSSPANNFIPTMGTATANRFNVEVQVAGPSVNVLVNGSPVSSVTDADLHPGSVGLMSWAERGSPALGGEFRSLNVQDSGGATLLNYGWSAALSNWRSLQMVNAAGGYIVLTGSGIGIDPTTGFMVENTNTYTNATTTAGLRNTDFLGAAMYYYSASSGSWTDYEVRARLFCQDNDSLGLLLRVANNRTFYRVSFVSEMLADPPQTWRAPGGVSVQRCRDGIWKELYRDHQNSAADPGLPLFAYAPHTNFDVSAKISTDGGATKIDITATPEGGDPVVIPTITDGPAEALITDVDGDSEFDPADGDVWSTSDTNNNGKWDPAEGLDIDVDGDHVFDPADGDVFSANDLNNNGQWDPGEPMVTDVNGNGMFDAGVDTWDTKDTNKNGRWDPAEPLAVDVDGDHVFDPLDGDVFDPAADPNNNGFWDGAPIPAGSAGLYSWGNDEVGASDRDMSKPRGAVFSSYAGMPADFVRTLAGSTLVGNVFVPYDNWISTYTGGQAGGYPPAWIIRVRDGVLIENSDGIQKYGGTTDGGTNGDGKYVPYVLVKDPAVFTTGTDYTIRATLHQANDDDGFGLVFGFVDSDNYFRVGFRTQATNYGFKTGTSIQKVVNGVITQLTSLPPKRSNQAGLWIKKLATGAIEQVAPADLADGSGQQGVEFQGPRLVAGDVNWTDYTFESVMEVRDDWGFGMLLRYQDELNYYRLTFSGEDFIPSGPPIGISVQKVAGGVYTELFEDTDPTSPGDNDTTPSAGFVYDGTENPDVGDFRIWRTRAIVSGANPTTIRIEIDAILEDGTEYPNYYTATVTDSSGTALTHGKVGFHTWAQTANEFRDISVTLAGQSEPVFVDGDGMPDGKGWVDATMGNPTNYDNPGNIDGEQGGTDGVAAGAPISGFGIRPDLNALGVRDNRYKPGVVDSALETGTGTGTIDFDGPRAVAGALNWQDYTYTVDLRQFDDDGTGVVFRYQDENNFYRLMFMSQSGNTLGAPPRGVSVQKRFNGSFSELFFDPGFIYTVGERWRTSVTAVGSHFDVQITELDGPRAGTVYNYSFDDPTDPLWTGKVGVTVWGSNGQANEGNTMLQTGGLDWTQNFSEGGVFDDVTVEGTLGRLPPDLDGDGRINDVDTILWMACYTGPAIPRTETTQVCDKADLDFDNDIDQDDFGWFQRCFTGNDAFVDANCVR